MPENINSLVANPFDLLHFAAATAHGWIYFLRGHCGFLAFLHSYFKIDAKREAPPSLCDLKYRISSEGAVGGEGSTDFRIDTRAEESEFVQVRLCSEIALSDA